MEELEELLEDFILIRDTNSANSWVNFMVIQVGGIVGRAINLSYLVSNTQVISRNTSITGLGSDMVVLVS